MTGNLQDIPIELAGQNYTLRFGMIAIVTLSEAWKVSEAEVEGRMAKAGLKDLVTIIWAGLQTHHPELTERQVLGWLDDGGVDALELATKAFQNAKPLARPPQGQRTKTRNR